MAGDEPSPIDLLLYDLLDTIGDGLRMKPVVSDRVTRFPRFAFRRSASFKDGTSDVGNYREMQILNVSIAGKAAYAVYELEPLCYNPSHTFEWQRRRYLLIRSPELPHPLLFSLCKICSARRPYYSEGKEKDMHVLLLLHSLLREPDTDH